MQEDARACSKTNGFWGELTRKGSLRLTSSLFLSKKYSNMQRGYYTKEIDDILEGLSSKALLDFSDMLVFIDSNDCIRKLYSFEVLGTRLKTLAEFYRYHEDVPRLFMRFLFAKIHYYYDKKRRINYLRVAKELQLEVVQQIKVHDSESLTVTTGSVGPSLAQFLPSSRSQQNVSRKHRLSSMSLTIDDLNEALSDALRMHVIPAVKLISKEIGSGILKRFQEETIVCKDPKMKSFSPKPKHLKASPSKSRTKPGEFKNTSSLYIGSLNINLNFDVDSKSRSKSKQRMMNPIIGSPSQSQFCSLPHNLTAFKREKIRPNSPEVPSNRGSHRNMGSAQLGQRSTRHLALSHSRPNFKPSVISEIGSKALKFKRFLQDNAVEKFSHKKTKTLDKVSRLNDHRDLKKSIGKKVLREQKCFSNFKELLGQKVHSHLKEVGSQRDSKNAKNSSEYKPARNKRLPVELWDFESKRAKEVNEAKELYSSKKNFKQFFVGPNSPGLDFRKKVRPSIDFGHLHARSSRLASHHPDSAALLSATAQHQGFLSSKASSFMLRTNSPPDKKNKLYLHPLDELFSSKLTNTRTFAFEHRSAKPDPRQLHRSQRLSFSRKKQSVQEEPLRQRLENSFKRKLSSKTTSTQFKQIENNFAKTCQLGRSDLISGRFNVAFDRRR